jgi:predicted secreted protein
MNPVAALVLYLVFWFMCLFIILPLRLQSQDEAGDVVPGTPASAPDDPKLKKKFLWVTIVATLVWIPVVAIIVTGVITIEDIDFFDRL